VNIFIQKLNFHYKGYFAFGAAAMKEVRVRLKSILKQQVVDIKILFALIEHYPFYSHFSTRALISLNIIPIEKVL
jgi:hypothetical protein